MTEPEKGLNIEEKIVQVDAWLTSFDLVARGEIEFQGIEAGLLREVLIHFGAEFDSKKEGMSKLKQTTNKWRRAGMDAVWGKGRMDDFNEWTNKWADAYEEATNRKLPKLDESGSRVSGMRHWLGELTAYAADAITFEQYRERQEIRLRNGYARSAGAPVEEASFLADSKKFPGSIPPGFARDAWGKVKNWKN